MKELLLVSIGSFFGGGLRYALSKVVQDSVMVSFPFGTLAVNVLGCLLLGFLSGLPWGGSLLSHDVRIVLTTGFCGGFTTFSTFMNEGSVMMRDGNFPHMMLYLFGSLAIGLAAVLLGNALGKVV